MPSLPCLLDACTQTILVFLAVNQEDKNPHSSGLLSRKLDCMSSYNVHHAIVIWFKQCEMSHGSVCKDWLASGRPTFVSVARSSSHPHQLFGKHVPGSPKSLVSIQMTQLKIEQRGEEEWFWAPGAWGGLSTRHITLKRSLNLFTTQLP